MPSVDFCGCHNLSNRAAATTDGRPAKAKEGWQVINFQNSVYLQGTNTTIYSSAMRHFVYVLANEHGHHYVGHTQDLNLRLKEHNSGTVPSTKKGRPWHIQWFCCFCTPEEAIAFERYLKSGSGVMFRQRHLQDTSLSRSAIGKTHPRTTN